MDRVSDVDVAAEIVPKEADPGRARIKNWRRVGELEQSGQRFRGLLSRDLCWYWEVFKFLKGGDRVISLVDLKHEGEFVRAVPHSRLYCDGQWSQDSPPRAAALRRYARLAEEDGLF